jgi:hypothetical protein
MALTQGRRFCTNLVISFAIKSVSILSPDLNGPWYTELVQILRVNFVPIFNRLFVQTGCKVGNTNNAGKN